MTIISAIETSRLQAQTRIDASKTPRDRNRLGQFATPGPLAQDIVDYALMLLPKFAPVRFLDPALGTGAFFSALTRAIPSAQISTATGYEIDSAYAEAALELWKETALQVQTADFLEATPPHTKPNLLVCNPPYVRHHHITPEKKTALRALIDRKLGIAVNGLSGLYCYFIFAAHDWLAEDAVATWLIPSEFMDVNYGRQLKQYLLERVTLIRVHRFDPADLQFNDAIVTNTILWFRNSTPPAHHAVQFTSGGSVTKPLVTKSIPSNALSAISKWANALSVDQQQTASARLSDYFQIKRGVATGANEFFILSPERAAELHLPSDVLLPILPGPRYLVQDEVAADEFRNPILDTPQFLLACNHSPDKVQAAYPAVWNYLQTGINMQIHRRYLSQHRSPWYAQETRQPTNFLCTYMGRRVSKASRPFRFIFNHSRAIASNVYLMMYPRPGLAQALAEQPQLARRIWSALNAMPPSALMREGRVYGDGLHKLEPKELANLPVDPNWFRA